MKKRGKAAKSPSKSAAMRAHYDFTPGMRGKHAARFVQGATVALIDGGTGNTPVETVRKTLKGRRP
jgi:hypothetical protein